MAARFLSTGFFPPGEKDPEKEKEEKKEKEPPKPKEKTATEKMQEMKIQSLVTMGIDESFCRKVTLRELGQQRDRCRRWSETNGTQTLPQRGCLRTCLHSKGRKPKKRQPSKLRWRPLKSLVFLLLSLSLSLSRSLSLLFSSLRCVVCSSLFAFHFVSGPFAGR